MNPLHRAILDLKSQDKIKTQRFLSKIQKTGPLIISFESLTDCEDVRVFSGSEAREMKNADGFESLIKLVFLQNEDLHF